MLSYLDYLTKVLSVPNFIVIAIIILFLFMQIIGEFMSFLGKTAPSFMKVRGFFKRKREEKEKLHNTLDIAMASLKKNEELLSTLAGFHSDDTIKKQNEWIDYVNASLAENNARWEFIKEKMDKMSEDTLELIIEGKRSVILEAATRLANPTAPATREFFRKIFKIYSEYEKIIAEKGLENGEVDISIQVIKKAYQDRLKTGFFIEDMPDFFLEKEKEEHN